MKFVSCTEKLFTKSVPSTMKMTVKGGAAVDPESGNIASIANNAVVDYSYQPWVFKHPLASCLIYS